MTDRINTAAERAKLGAAVLVGAYRYAAALDEIDRLREALAVCRDEIDEYILHEYPTDHPAQVRMRERDFSANPARHALSGEGET